MVTAPDGSGKTIMVTVPQGLTSGSTFMAEFPASTSSPPPSVVSSSLASAAPAPPPRPAQVEVEPVDYSQMAVLPPPTQTTAEPFAQAVPIGVGPNDTTISATPVRPTTAPTALPPPPPTQSPLTSFTSPLTVVVPTNTTQKLLLVQVPPGVAAGTTLHVSIPNEPGRLVAATVPPNVREFQVAYTPSMNRSTNPPPNRNNDNSMMNGRPNHGFHNNPNNRYNNNNNNGMGSMLLPALGGAALGMAGMSVFNHAHHGGYDNNNNNNYSDNAAGNDNYGDYDGGGGFGDFGGGDF